MVEIHVLALQLLWNNQGSFRHPCVEWQNLSILGFIRPGQVWGHTPKQRVPASFLRRYSFGFRLAIARQARRARILQMELHLTQ